MKIHHSSMYHINCHDLTNTLAWRSVTPPALKPALYCVSHTCANEVANKGFNPRQDQQEEPLLHPQSKMHLPVVWSTIREIFHQWRWRGWQSGRWLRVSCLWGPCVLHTCTCMYRNCQFCLYCCHILSCAAQCLTNGAVIWVCSFMLRVLDFFFSRDGWCF
jgi:hypothetical protein